MRYVSPREREILRMRFAQDMTQAEIGEIVGVSQMQVSRILRGSIARMSVLAQQPPAPSEAESCAGPA
jgi:RNA polymerase sigma-B factor